MSGPPLDRVVVVGISGSGKSTTAAALAERLGSAHVELDALHWLPAWTPRPRDEFRAVVTSALTGDRWVVDGNYSQVRDVVWPQATAIVWLDLPFAAVWWRVLARTLRRAWRRELLWNTNRESLRLAFCSRESILWWVLTMHGPKRRQFRALCDAERATGSDRWIELRSAAEVDAWLASVRA